MPKHTIEQVKNFSPELKATLINRMRAYLKKDPTMNKVFDEYDVDISEIDLVPMAFKEIDTSATTDHGIIYFSYKLLCDGDFFKDFAYGVHECTHWIQQCSGDKPTKGANDGEYLDNEYEIEGFQNQIEWLAETFGKEEAEKYTDQMLGHHELKGKDKEEKFEELTEKIEK